MLIDLPNVTPSALVDLNFVRVCRRVSADEVLALAESGQLAWTWNVSVCSKSPTSGIRELRFWLSEVVTPQMTARLTIDEVLERLMPISRQALWAAEVGQLLLLSRVTVAQLARLLGATLKNRTFQFRRDRLADWLRSRWTGGQP